MPIKGKLLVNLNEPFEAKSVTLSLKGFQRSHFTPTRQGDQFGQVTQGAAAQQMTRLAKTVVSDVFTIAEFPEGSVMQG